MAQNRVYLETLGCKLNQAETEQLARNLASAGYAVASSPEEADVYILNTCTVTHIADRKSRQLLRQVRRRNPYIKLVVTGCYAERAAQALAEIEGVDLVTGNTEKADLVAKLQESGLLTAQDTDVPPYAGRTRSFIKIQDGCRNFCAYCIVPLVRGEEKSVAAAQVLSEIKKRVAEGFKEVVLTGTEVGSYCDGNIDLKGLLERILRKTGIARIRLSSLQPQEISPELIGLWRDERLCPHFHLSLQSGSDSMLKRMRRRYTIAGYERAVSLIREVMPDAGITTDIIVGFPGETEAEFEESYHFCEKIEFARIHVFSYSARPGTAADMPGRVNEKVKKARSERSLTLAKESARRFHEKFLGRVMPVLWEQKENGFWSGYTGNYIKVYTESSEDLTNRLTQVRLGRVWGEGVEGV